MSKKENVKKIKIYIDEILNTKSRFTKTGRPPGVMEKEKNNKKEKNKTNKK